MPEMGIDWSQVEERATIPVRPPLTPELIREAIHQDAIDIQYCVYGREKAGMIEVGGTTSIGSDEGDLVFGANAIHPPLTLSEAYDHLKVALESFNIECWRGSDEFGDTLYVRRRMTPLLVEESWMLDVGDANGGL